MQQQQGGGGYGTVSFTSQLGTFDISSLREVGTQQTAESLAAATASEPDAPTPSAPQAAGAPSDPGSIIAAIEALAGLHDRGILSDDEFAAKKAELLARL